MVHLAQFSATAWCSSGDLCEEARSHWLSSRLSSRSIFSSDSDLVRSRFLLVLMLLALTILLLSLQLLFCSSLLTSSARTSFITSALLSSLSAPCGVVLSLSSIRTLQRSECACALLLSLIALQPGHPIVPPHSLMSCLVILSLWFRAPSNGNGGIGMGSTRTSGLSTVHFPSVILHGTPITLLTASVSHLS